MPENTRTEYERWIADYTDRRHIIMSRSKTQRLALKMHKRQVRMEDPELARYITYSDPTGNTAVNNVMRQETTPGHSRQSVTPKP